MTAADTAEQTRSAEQAAATTSIGEFHHGSR